MKHKTLLFVVINSGFVVFHFSPQATIDEAKIDAPVGMNTLVDGTVPKVKMHSLAE